MIEKIFKSELFLSFRRPEVRHRYFQIRKSNLLNRYRVFSATSLMLSLACSCLITNFPTIENNQKSINSFLLYMTWSISLLIFITNILNFTTKNLSFLRWFNYLEFLLLPIICTFIRIVLEKLTKNNIPFSNFLTLLEICARGFILRPSIFTFFESLFLTFGSIVILWGFLYNMATFSQLSQLGQLGQLSQIDYGINFYLVYTFMLLILLVFSYYIERIIKESFGMKYIQGNKLRCLTDAFEKVETGFLLIRAGKVSFINLFLKQNLHKFFKATTNHEIEIESNLIIIY
jgi:hypothetical protein